MRLLVLAPSSERNQTGPDSGRFSPPWPYDLVYDLVSLSFDSPAFSSVDDGDVYRLVIGLASSQVASAIELTIPSSISLRASLRDTSRSVS